MNRLIIVAIVEKSIDSSNQFFRLFPLFLSSTHFETFPLHIFNVLSTFLIIVRYSACVCVCVHILSVVEFTIQFLIQLIL